MMRNGAIRSRIRRLDIGAVVGFCLPIGLAILIGVAIHAHSKPISLAQTAGGSPTAPAEVSGPLPTADEVAAANSAVLAYCNSDLRKDTSCALVANSDTTAPGFVEVGLKMNGSFASDGGSSQGLALTKGSGSSWTVIWVGQNCVPQDIANKNGVPASLNICAA